MPPTPYRLPELIKPIAVGCAVLIVDGEAKVDLLHSWDIRRLATLAARRSGGPRTASICVAPTSSFYLIMMIAAAIM